MHRQIRMLTTCQVFHHIFQQLAVLHSCLIPGNHLGVLLYGPYHPQQHVRMFDFRHFQMTILSFHKGIHRFYGSVHNHLKLTNFSNRQCQSRQRNEHVACPTFEPRISGQNVRFTLLLVQELMSGVNQTVLKVITWSTLLYFGSKQSI